MGVDGLWKLLPAAGEPVSLLKLASEHAFNANFRPYTLGIDASLWTYHAQAASGTGENAEIELIFHRCCRLLSMPVAPLFVFDGPDRPKKRRNEKKTKANSAKTKVKEGYFLNGIRGVVASFGFETLTAPGEAEATLAQLNSTGVIDAIMSDDVDCFLFGAKTVLRSVMVNDSSYGEYVKIYSSEALQRQGFSQEELIFIALLSGGDYDSGLPDCGITTASQLRFLGFGRSLKAIELADTRSEELLSEWGSELRKELETNASAALSQKNCKAASNLTNDFPRREIVRAYFSPTVFNDSELESFTQILWKNQLELWRISEMCETYFMWSSEAGILKTFERLVWPGVLFRLILNNSRKLSEKVPTDLDLPLIVVGFKHAEFGIQRYQVNVPTKWFISETLRGIENRRAINFDTIISPLRSSSHHRGPTVSYDCQENVKMWVPKLLLDYMCPEVGKAYFEELDLKHLKKKKKRNVTSIHISESAIPGLELGDNESVIIISSDSEACTMISIGGTGDLDSRW